VDAYQQYLNAPCPVEKDSILHFVYFAKEFLKVKYMFWSNQEPYFRTDVLSCFRNDQ